MPLSFALAQGAAGLAAEPATGPARRFALVVGANRGAADRIPLRYAVADAERFADLVSTMGGVLPADRIDLHDPDRKALLAALERTGARAASAKATASRVEVIFYFSGHADDKGLMLGREMVPYRELRTAVSSMGADVGITILDACASGAITRLKGGKTHPGFLTGPGSDIQGYAFLTSSSENETAQESERLRGSFFTHALVSGLRGAADASGDGRVTLNEAYQFAFHETLVQTAPTEGGTQHPSYDIRMAGTGEVVMTDVRQTSSSLVLGEELEGRFVVLSDKSRLVAELYKPAGRRVELGLDAGRIRGVLRAGEAPAHVEGRPRRGDTPGAAARAAQGGAADGDPESRRLVLRRRDATPWMAASACRPASRRGRRASRSCTEATAGWPGSSASGRPLSPATPTSSWGRGITHQSTVACGRTSERPLAACRSPSRRSRTGHPTTTATTSAPCSEARSRRAPTSCLTKNFSLNVDLRGTFAQGGFWEAKPSIGLGFSFGGR